MFGKRNHRHCRFYGIIVVFVFLSADIAGFHCSVRQDLLRWLVRESDERGATIIYATHIFDGLGKKLLGLLSGQPYGRNRSLTFLSEHR